MAPRELANLARFPSDFLLTCCFYDIFSVLCNRELLPMPKVYITNSVRKFREMRRLNVIQLADMSGVSAATIHRLEEADGHVNTQIDSAWLLSRALGCAMTDLFAFDPQPGKASEAALSSRSNVS